MTDSTASRIAFEAARQNVSGDDARFTDFVNMQYRSITAGRRSDRSYGTPTDASPELVAKVREELTKTASVLDLAKFSMIDGQTTGICLTVGGTEVDLRARQMRGYTKVWTMDGEPVELDGRQYALSTDKGRAELVDDLLDNFTK